MLQLLVNYSQTNGINTISVETYIQVTKATKQDLLYEYIFFYFF